VTEFLSIRQDGAHIFVADTYGDEIRIPVINAPSVLMVALAALRQLPEDEQDAAAKTCKSFLGRRRFE
jgi:hypothetical protein